MAAKQIMDKTFLKKIFDQVCEFAKKESTPSNYCLDDEPENALQIHISKYLSRWHDVLREVNIPAVCHIDGSGDNLWEIDESLQLEAINRRIFYATGELKFHGDGMVSRDFVTEAENDIKRMLCVADRYFDATMAFTLFITCDKKEIDSVIAFATKIPDEIVIQNLEVSEKGYYAIATLYIPKTKEDSHDPLYGQHWKERIEYLKLTNQLKDNFFSGE